jgi:hypothetical protein
MLGSGPSMNMGGADPVNFMRGSSFAGNTPQINNYFMPGAVHNISYGMP